MELQKIDLGRGWEVVWDGTEGIIFKHHGGIEFGTGTRNARPLFEAIYDLRYFSSGDHERLADIIVNAYEKWSPHLGLSPRQTVAMILCRHRSEK